MTEEAQRLEHAARLLRMFGEVRRAYIETGWISVGLLLSNVDADEIREVADWVATYAQERSGPDSGNGNEKSPPDAQTPSRGTDGSVREDPPSPAVLVTSPNDPLAAGATAPYDWETEGLGGT